MDNDMREIWSEARNSAYTILDSEFRRVMQQEGAEQVLPKNVKVGDVVTTLHHPPQKVTAVRDTEIYVQEDGWIDPYTEPTFRLSGAMEVKPDEVVVFRDEEGVTFLATRESKGYWNGLSENYVTILSDEEVTMTCHIGPFEDVVAREDAGMVVTEEALREQETRAAVDQYCEVWWVEGGQLFSNAPGHYGAVARPNVPDASILRWVYPKSQHGTIGDEG